jgi:hypothetical protein
MKYFLNWQEEQNEVQIEQIQKRMVHQGINNKVTQ